MEGRADSRAEQLHLPVLIRAAVVKVEYFWPAVFGDSGAHDGHEVHKVVLEKDVNAGNEAACVVDQGDDIDLLFPAVSDHPGADAGIAAPDFVDVRAFVAAHVPVVRHCVFCHEPVYEAVDGGLGSGSLREEPVAEEGAADHGGGHSGVTRLHVPDKFLALLIEAAGFARVGAALWQEGVKAIF